MGFTRELSKKKQKNKQNINNKMKNSLDMPICCETNGPWLQGLGSVNVWAHRAETDTFSLSLEREMGFLTQQQPNLYYE